MATRVSKKKSLLCVLEVLKEYTDKDHILKQSELKELVEINYDLIIDRRTLYANIDLLIEFGYDISTFNDNKIGYYLNDRVFSERDSVVLAKAIIKDDDVHQSSKERIINQLVAQHSRYRKKNLLKRIYAK